MILTIIVNGNDVAVPAELADTLAEVRDAALRLSNNTGRPFTEWEVYNDRGECLDTSLQIEELPINDGDRLFVTLKTGAGGEI